jgi:hypothetical protein
VQLGPIQRPITPPSQTVQAAPHTLPNETVAQLAAAGTANTYCHPQPPPSMPAYQPLYIRPPLAMSCSTCITCMCMYSTTLLRQIVSKGRSRAIKAPARQKECGTLELTVLMVQITKAMLLRNGRAAGDNSSYAHAPNQALEAHLRQTQPSVQATQQVLNSWSAERPTAKRTSRTTNRRCTRI